LALTILIIYNSHGISNFLNTINATAKSLTIIPKTNSVSFTNFLVFICVQWWSASILDYPDMNGQKLLASKSMRDITKTILVPSLVLIVFKIVLLSFTFLVINNTLSNTVDSEFAFANVFLTSLPNWALPLVLVFFGISFLAIVQNHQNWSGSLLAENFYKTYINSKISAKKSNRIGIYCMLYVIALAGIIAFYSNSIMYMVKLLFTITAGVGPVFILRWYWWRINAWSQLSAMVSAMLMPLVYDLLFENNSWFFKMIIALENGFKIDQYPIKIIFLTLFVSLIWITITFLTKPTEQSKVKSFAETVQPGGYWKGIKNSGKLHLTKRLFIWVLLASNSLITIAVLWNFVQLQFFICACLLAVYVLFFFVSYKMLNHINNS
jgi:Na+/proline symporter